MARTTGFGAGPAALLMILAVFMTGPAEADELDVETMDVPPRVDVLLRSGEMLEDVAYEVDHRFRALKLTVGEDTRTVSYRDVAAIVTGNRDVTEQLLGEGYGAAAGSTGGSGPEPVSPEVSSAATDGDEKIGGPVSTDDGWLSEDSVQYRSATAAVWSKALRLATNYSMPMGDYYTGMEKGVGFEGELWLAANRRIGVQLSVSRSGMKLPEGMTSLVATAGGDLDMSATRYCISGMVYRHLDEQRRDLGMIYGRVGLGMIDHKITATAVADGMSVSVSDSDSKFMLTVGGGVLTMLSETLGLDLSASLDQVYVSAESNYYGSSINYGWIFDLRVGGVLFF